MDITWVVLVVLTTFGTLSYFLIDAISDSQKLKIQLREVELQQQLQVTTLQAEQQKSREREAAMRLRLREIEEGRELTPLSILDDDIPKEIPD